MKHMQRYSFLVAGLQVLVAVFGGSSRLGADESAAAAAEQAGRLREAFSLYVAAYQALPDPPAPADDFRLRERIIKLAARLDPPPELSEDAQRSAVRARMLVQQATGPQDLANAEQEMRKAIRAAPWDATLAFNLGVIQEKTGRYVAALANVRLYVAADPEDAAQARTKLFELEFGAEREAKLKRYLAGDNVAESPQELERFLEQACEAGTGKACTDVATMLLYRAAEAKLKNALPDLSVLTRVPQLYQKGCERGDGDACAAAAGFSVAAGPGAAQAALALLEGGCEQGGMNACSVLGTLYSGEAMQGWTAVKIATNASRAATLLDKACSGEVWTACARLALLHDKGVGVTRDKAKAARLRQAGLALGEKQCSEAASASTTLRVQKVGACNSLGDAYVLGRYGLPRDKRRAAAYFDKGCSIGDFIACEAAKRLR